jgi:hypothetical protein
MFRIHAVFTLRIRLISIPIRIWFRIQILFFVNLRWLDINPSF